MNHIDKPSVYRGNERSENWEVIGSQAPVAEPIEETSTDILQRRRSRTINTESRQTVETPRIESSEEPETTEDTESTEETNPAANRGDADNGYPTRRQGIL